jgi:hypothetical protein
MAMGLDDGMDLSITDERDLADYYDEVAVWLSNIVYRRCVLTCGICRTVYTDMPSEGADISQAEVWYAGRVLSDLCVHFILPDTLV